MQVGGDDEVGILPSGRPGDVRGRLSPADLARMGERFFRADKSGHIPGTGLGVSIVYELVQLMGGQVEIESELGNGTRVTLWLPACDADTGKVLVASASPGVERDLSRQ